MKIRSDLESAVWKYNWVNILDNPDLTFSPWWNYSATHKDRSIHESSTTYWNVQGSTVQTPALAHLTTHAYYLLSHTCNTTNITNLANEVRDAAFILGYPTCLSAFQFNYCQIQSYWIMSMLAHGILIRSPTHYWTYICTFICSLLNEDLHML
jgi:hypothetical protein